MRGAVAEAYVEAQENAKFSGLRAPATNKYGPESHACRPVCCVRAPLPKLARKRHAPTETAGTIRGLLSSDTFPPYSLTKFEKERTSTARTSTQ